jgi:dipeptide/tripeptide permease
VLAIILVSLLSVIFWLFYYQQDLAITIYMTKYVNMTVGTFEVPPSWVTTTFNGLLCVVLGGVMAAIWKKLAARPQGDMNMFQKVGMAFLFLGLAFGIMVVAEFTRGIGASETSKVSVIWLFAFVLLLTIGEMCFSPLKDAFVSKYAPKKYTSLLMGVIIMSTFCASKLSPFVQVVIDRFDVFPAMAGIFIILIVCALLMILTNGKLNKLVEEDA